MKSVSNRVTLIVLILIVLGTIYSCASVPKMKKETLKTMLGNPDVIVVDVRQSRYWKKSGQRIKGAVCEDPTKVEEWIKKYPKDKTIVFYCA